MAPTTRASREAALPGSTADSRPSQSRRSAGPLGGRALLMVALCPLACSTTYEPKSPRVAVVGGEFRRGFVKDGIYYPGGLFGGRVGDAVKGVPEAERHASAYATLSTAGTWTIFGAEGIAIGASVVSATAPRGEGRNDAELGLIIGSAVAFVTGIALHLAAEPHLYDAANVYNDEMDRRRAAPVGRAAPGIRAPVIIPTEK